MSALPVEQLLIAYRRLQDQYDAEIDIKLDELSGLIAQFLMGVRQREQPFLRQKSQLVAQINPYLEEDARCLLSTTEFRAFVEQFIKSCQASSGIIAQTLLLTPAPSTWILPRLNTPLQLQNYQLVQEDSAYLFRLTASLGNWQQDFTVDIARPTPNNDLLEIFSLEEQWREVEAQMLGEIHVTENGSQLSQEISSLICFTGLTLETIPKMTWFSYP